MNLVLSLFPGIGLLDMAFEEEGFCVVRGPDLLWGGDVKRLHPPARTFDGVIGGPPCQEHTELAHLNRTQGYRTKHGDQIPEFERVVAAAQPVWFVMENAPQSPAPKVRGYSIHSQLLRDVWVGGETVRQRRISFGTADDCCEPNPRLDIEVLALHRPEAARAVTGDARVSSVGERLRKSGSGKTLPLDEMLRLQGLSADFFGDDCPFTEKAKRQMIGNGVPLAMGRAVAKAVKAALSPTRESEAMSEWKPVDDMPKDGAPFLAYVKDWYARQNRYHLLRMNINGYWESAYTGDQTFEREDIVECQELPVPSALIPNERQAPNKDS